MLHGLFPVLHCVEVIQLAVRVFFAYAHVHYTANNNNYIASCDGGLWEQG